MMKKLELKYENDFEEIHKELNIHTRQSSKNCFNTETGIMPQHKSTNSLCGVGGSRIQNMNGLGAISPTMMSSYSKLQNLHQIK